MELAVRNSPPWIKIAWAIPGFVVLSFLPLPAMAGIAVLGLAGITFLWKRHRLIAFWGDIKPIWPLLIVLFAFFYFPFSSVDPKIRTSGEHFSIYSRFVAGLSIWEMLLLLCFGVLLWRKWRSGMLNLSFGNWQGVPLYLFFLALAIAIGLLHVEGSVLGYGPTELRWVVIAAMPIAYFLAVFLLIVNIVEKRQHVERLMTWLDRFTFGLIIYGVVRLFLILSGYMQTLIPFGVPIVLYDQMNLFYAPIFIITARLVMKEKPGALQYANLGLMLFFILCSTRRFNYIFLVFGLGAVLAIGVFVKSWCVRRLVGFLSKSVVTLALALIALMIAVPNFVDGVVNSVNSINMFSKYGQKYGGDSRVAQLENIYANLERRPYAYLVGFGLGTKWQAIEPQPMDSMAFPEEYMRQSKGWYPKFHLPYVASFYRFGILGLAFLITWLGFYLRTFLRTLRAGNVMDKAYCIGAIAFLAICLPMIGDSTNPVLPIICGIYMGLLEKLAANHPARASVEDES
jgi:hypothetical protein